MKKLKEWAKKSPFLFFVVSVIRLGRTRTGRSRIVGILNNPRSIVVEKRGDALHGHLICEIDPVVKYSGFFHVFRRLLSALYFADEIGAEPFVKYDKSFIYAEETPIYGTDNPFEYYFESINRVSELEIKSANAVVVFDLKNAKIAESLNGPQTYTYRASIEYIDEMSKVFNKYIRLNERMRKYVCDGITDLGITERTLAVHCRGTDFNCGSKNHPIIISVDDYFRIIDQLLSCDFDNIFLATDDLNRLELFKKRYKEKVLYYCDVQRSSGNEGVHFSKSERNNHKYLLGAEVTRDVFTMASCGGIVAGMSEVSLNARIIKKASSNEYRTEIIIDNGFVEHGAYFKHD